MRHIYLDYNATTPVAPSVLEAMLPFLSEHHGNPSSSHSFGRACAEAIQDARSQVAALLGCESDEIIFTGGGTESNNLALKGALMRGAPAAAGHLVISAIEHPAIIEPAAFLERLGYGVTIVPASTDGVVSPRAIESAIRMDTVLVSVMHSNNETGVLQPIKEIAEICHARDVLIHTDASQSVGKVRTFVNEMNVDLLTIAGHKLYAPKGIGALYVRNGVALEPVLHGAGHEGGLRAGTENTPYIVGLGRAAQLAGSCLDESQERLAKLRDRLWSRLSDELGENVHLNCARSPRLPNTLNVIFRNAVGQEILKRTPDLCASTGAACHSGSVSMSATLASLGLTPEEASGCIRLSVGWYTSEEDIDRAASLLIDAYENTAL